jgi:hypothetical protein
MVLLPNYPVIKPDEKSLPDTHLPISLFVPLPKYVQRAKQINNSLQKESD